MEYEKLKFWGKKDKVREENIWREVSCNCN